MPLYKLMIKMRKSALSRAPVSDETRSKLSAKFKGVKKSDEHRVAIKIAAQNRKRKKIIS